ncbi:MAG: hypothetical protein IPK75_19045 [Acidobacteria bacterium]|nr:hypothetical protein [Acidobacteriota bacterium]
MEYLDLSATKPFKPSAKYNHGLDVLAYRAEGGTCVADRVDGFLTILWDKEQKRIVGIRLKGFRWVFNELKGRFKWTDADFLPLVKVLEAVMSDGLGLQIVADQREKYELAKGCVRNFHLTREELTALAA